MLGGGGLCELLGGLNILFSSLLSDEGGDLTGAGILHCLMSLNVLNLNTLITR